MTSAAIIVGYCLALVAVAVLCERWSPLVILGLIGLLGFGKLL